MPGALWRVWGGETGRLGDRIYSAGPPRPWGLELAGLSVRDCASLGFPLQNPHRRQTLQVPTPWLRKGFHSALQPPGECPSACLLPTDAQPPTPSHREQQKGVGLGSPPSPTPGGLAPDPPLCSPQSHQRQHNKDKPYKCPNCYRAYSDSASLQIHLSAHAIKHAKAYCCSMCGRAYTSVSAWAPGFSPLTRQGN